LRSSETYSVFTRVFPPGFHGNFFEKDCFTEAPFLLYPDLYCCKTRKEFLFCTPPLSMKKPLFISFMTVLVLSATLSLSGTSTIHASRKTIATCYGYSPCKACSNCSQCKHCTNGGRCGVCTRPVLRKSSTPKAPLQQVLNAVLQREKASAAPAKLPVMVTAGSMSDIFKYLSQFLNLHHYEKLLSLQK
jgi:hypothetical protein